MLETIEKLMDSLPPFHARKNENLALVIGFLAGGIGLAIYLRSLIDLVLPLGLSLVLAKTLGDVGVLGGAVLSALWGHFRVRSSNKRLAP